MSGLGERKDFGLKVVDRSLTNFHVWTDTIRGISKMQPMKCTLIYRRIFGFNKWESVKSFICGLEKIDFWHMKFVLGFLCEAAFL